MSILPQVKPKLLLKALIKSGFAIQKQRGSHVDLKHPDGRRTSVPMHNKPVGKGLLHAILHQSHMTLEELKNLL